MSATSPSGVIFHPASAINAAAVAQAQAQATLRRRILRALVGRGLLQSSDTKEMLGYHHHTRTGATGCDAGRASHYKGALGAAPPDNALPTLAEPAEPVPPRRPAHYLWAVLIARIYEVFGQLCPNCGGQMRLIAFITYSADIGQILDHIGVDSQPPHIFPARGPLLWEDCDAQVGEGSQIEPDWDLAAQPAPDYEVDQRINW